MKDDQIRLTGWMLACCGALLFISSCSGGFGDPIGGRGVTPDISDLCGTRTAASIPGPGRLRTTSVTTTVFEPADSALAAIVVPITQALAGCEEGEPVVVEFDLDETGVITAIDGEATDLSERFVIADACLEIEAVPDPNDTPDNTNDNSTGDDEPPPDDEIPPDELCGTDGFPIYQRLLDADPETDPYFCLRAREGESCQDCSQNDGEWTFDTRSVVTFTAMGSLEDVQTVDLCEETAELVNIRVGDTVRMTITTTTRFEIVTE